VQAGRCFWAHVGVAPVTTPQDDIVNSIWTVRVVPEGFAERRAREEAAEVAQLGRLTSPRAGALG